MPEAPNSDTLGCSVELPNPLSDSGCTTLQPYARTTNRRKYRVAALPRRGHSL